QATQAFTNSYQYVSQKGLSGVAKDAAVKAASYAPVILDQAITGGWGSALLSTKESVTTYNTSVKDIGVSQQRLTAMIGDHKKTLASGFIISGGKKYPLTEEKRQEILKFIEEVGGKVKDYTNDKANAKTEAIFNVAEALAPSGIAAALSTGKKIYEGNHIEGATEVVQSMVGGLVGENFITDYAFKIIGQLGQILQNGGEISCDSIKATVVNIVKEDIQEHLNNHVDGHVENITDSVIGIISHGGIKC
nr:hypothetical protein [Parachlamydiaceae bacterium]